MSKANGFERKNWKGGYVYPDLKFPASIIFILSFFLLLINLSEPMIYILDEAKNAECAREMLISGNYLVPYFNGELRTDKPPLHYFFMVLSYKLFGVSAFSARFFSAVFGALTILVTFLFSRKIFDSKTAFFSALVLIASLHFNFQMRLAVPDPYLIFFMTATFVCFYMFFKEDKMLWLWLMYIGFGLGFLTKGPVAIGLPGLAMFLFLLISRELNLNTILKFRLPAGILIVLIVAAPWYWLNYRATDGAWTEGFFLKHNLRRYTDTMEGHGGFFLLPFIMVVLGLLPFGVFSIQALFTSWRERTKKAILFCFIIVLTIVVFFSFSETKLPNYTAPAYPFAAILLGILLSRLTENQLNIKPVKWALGFYTFVAFAIPVGIYVAFKSDPNMAQHSYLGLYFLALPFGAVLGWNFLKRNRGLYFVYTIAASFVITNILFFTRAYPAVYANNPVSASAEALQNQRNLVGYKMMNSAFVFNFKRIIPGFDSPESLKSYLNSHPDAIVITRKKYQPEIDSLNLELVFEQRDTFEKPVTAIYRIKGEEEL